jgi:hypothetical protein
VHTSDGSGLSGVTKAERKLLAQPHLTCACAVVRKEQARRAECIGGRGVGWLRGGGTGHGAGQRSPHQLGGVRPVHKQHSRIGHGGAEGWWRMRHGPRRR